MKKIALIIPYFGRLPHYFALWLLSCRYNPDIDFLLYTDDNRSFDYPENVHVCYCTFDDIRDKIRQVMPFPIALKESYKLCDYRPAYGEVFADALTDYDFWGHCDLDLIWGNIRRYITDEILENHDKILARGHFCLYRNDPDVNRRYQLPVGNDILYRKIFTNDAGFAFDEWTGIFAIYKEHHFSIYNAEVAADISVKFKGFCVNSDCSDKHRDQIFMWTHTSGTGQLLRYSVINRNELVTDEFMYIHLQKRNMEMVQETSLFDTAFLIVPNRFIPLSQIPAMDISYIRQYKNIRRYNQKYLLSRVQSVKKKIYKCLPVPNGGK